MNEMNISINFMAKELLFSKKMKGITPLSSFWWRI